MKVELVVVQGNPEGKRIHLTIPVFRIGRGETCHLRPNSERVSREHAEFALKDNVFTVRDLGSRNGTLVNGKPIAEQTTLARGDLVTVGPLTFAVAFDGDQTSAAPAAVAPAAPAEKPAAASPSADIASWLFDEKSPAEEKPSGVYGGETITIHAFKSGLSGSSGITEAAKMDDQGFERQDTTTDEEEVPEEFMDEDNPFNVKKKAPEAAPEPTAAKKEAYKDTSDAAHDILRRMMERSKES